VNAVIRTFRVLPLLAVLALGLPYAQATAQTPVTPTEASAIAKAPFNTLMNVARVYTPEDSAVQTPNSDTPYRRPRWSSSTS
jgi:hypothetical protein